MNNTKGIVTFRYLDLSFFSILAAVSEIMSYGTLKFWNSSFYFSFSMALCLISMIRWGAAGVVVAMIGGIPMLLYIFLSHCSLSAGKGMIIFLLTGELTGAMDYFGATFFL